ncbi:MAG: ATP-dependent DNA helicase [Firmicutes bacterium]|nr:ATP-dependent DNA helicase [Bacillota bacterium]
MEKRTVHISVRQIVEYVFKSGDIDARYSSLSAALLGIKIHEKLQKKRKKEIKKEGGIYESEIKIKTETEYKDVIFEIEGRIDGLKTIGNEIVIEEIKSTSREISEANKIHFAQAKCYAYMYALLYDKSEIGIMLTYCDTQDMEEMIFEEKFDFCTLKQFFYDMIEVYYKFEKFCFDMHMERNISAENFSFPFGEYRKGQREFSVAVYKSIADGKDLFAQAPTGTGKTVSVLFPCVKYFSREHEINTKIFYLTAKNMTGEAAEKCMRLMNESGLKAKTVVLTAKEKICLNGETSCYPQKCGYACGHYDRVNEALYDIFENEYLIDREKVIEYAEKHNVCPFEFSLDITSAADIIICDYNYAFSPKSRLKRFFSDEAEKGDYIALVDEAHNLSDRARDMFSAEISKSDVLSARKNVKNKFSPLYKAISKLNDHFLGKMHIISEDEAVVERKFPEELMYCLEDIVYRINEWLKENENQEITEFLFKVKDVIRIAELYGEDHRLMYIKNGRDMTIKIINIDPSRLMREMSGNLKSKVFFSATLIPIDYFMDIFGSEEANYIRLSSPFESGNLCVITDTSISTKYEHREKSYAAIAERISSFIKGKTGNYLVFFSSYEYLGRVYDIFTQIEPGIKIKVQERSMKESDKGIFLEGFREDTQETLVGFAVLGGAFSEGIDLVGGRLIGCVIVGVGMPMISIERNLIREYYDEKSECGFEYAYIYPGMNKVLQAVGRVIRTESDRGAALLIDSRFSQSVYTKLFPIWWKDIKRANGNRGIEKAVCDFFGSGVE